LSSEELTAICGGVIGNINFNEGEQMAEKRMFAKTIIDSDAFLDMPLSAQALYFHLSMRADDEGFINNPKKIQRMIGASDDDCKLLIMKRYIIAFESGVIVIKHWRIHNYIQKDRFKETLYKEERRELVLDEKNAYTEANKPCIQNGNEMYTQDSKELEIEQISKELEKKYILPENPKKNDGQYIKTIVDYLNSKADTKYRASTESTARHIRARLNEGFTVDDFFSVIDKKVAEWKGSDMEKYLRPETLFGSKFESYLNARSRTNNRRGANGILIDDRQTDELDGIL